MTRHGLKNWVVLSAFPACVSAAAALEGGTPNAIRADRLATSVGQPITLTLDLPDGSTWKEANVGQFVIRQSGEQRTLETDSTDTRTIALLFDRPGFVLVAVGVGPAREKGFRDSWQRTPHCAKLLVHVADRDDKPMTPGTGLTAKVGGKVEIVPLMDPTQMAPGDDLPVRCYFEGDKLFGQTVRAIAPDGTSSEAVTDAVGATHFRLSKPGRWTIRFTRTVESVTYTAELIFDLPKSQARPPRGEGDAS